MASRHTGSGGRGRGVGHPTSATPELAKAAWDSMTQPTFVQVAKKLAQAGFPVSHNIIKAWKENGWKRPQGSARHPESKYVRAQNMTEATLSVLTGDAATKLSDLVPIVLKPPTIPMSVVDAKLDELKAMSDLALMREANRSAAITVSMLNEQIQAQRQDLVALKPEELGNLVKSLALFLSAANEGYDQFTRLQERLMTVIGAENGGRDKSKPDPLAEALEAWRNPNKNVESEGRPVQHTGPSGSS